MRSSVTSWIVCLCTISPSLALDEIVGDNDSVTIDNIQVQYRLYKRYKDAGDLIVTYYENEQISKITKVKFTTSFERNGEFIISWVDILENGGSGLSYKIWTDNQSVFSQYGADPLFQSPTLYDALSRATGMSSSITYYVPCLLMPSMNCFVCGSGIETTELHPDPSNSNLQKINIKYKSKNIETVWIDQTRQQLRKVEWWNDAGAFRVHHQIRYNFIEAE